METRPADSPSPQSCDVPSEEVGATAVSAIAHGYGELASLLLTPPDEETLPRLVSLCALAGWQPPAALEAAALRQRFDDRLLVTASPLYVPLSESRLAPATKVDGRWRYGPAADSATDHVSACYRAAGFDPHADSGADGLMGSKPADYLGFELAFMAWLAAAELQAPEGRSASWRRFSTEFRRRHLDRWAAKAADLMAEGAEDPYASLVRLAAAWVALDAEMRP